MYFKQKAKVRIRDFTEASIITLVMMFIFLPLRVLFATYITPHWFGSFGLLTSVLITLLYLSKKNKLGIFGRMFWKQTTKLHKGKRRIVSYTIIVLAVYFWSSVIYGIHYAEDNENTQALILKWQENLSEQDKQNIAKLEKALEDQDLIKVNQMLQDRYRSLDWQYLILGIPIMFFLPLISIDLWSVAVYTMNIATNGYFLHFGTIFFIEVLEVIGIMIYIRIITRNAIKTDKV